MKLENEFFELNANKISVCDNEEVVNTRDSVKWNIDKTKFICKTREGLVASGVMNPHTALTLEEKEALVRSNEYQNNEI